MEKDLSPKYKSETPTNEVLRVYKQYSACSEAMDWCKQFEGKPFGELIDNIEDTRCDQSWIVWHLHIFGEKTSLELRKKMFHKIKDTMTAFSLYLQLPWLTDVEDKLLKEKFKGKLPTAEAVLAKGIVKREKNVHNSL